MIFQDALSALNPVFTVGFQIAEQFRIRRGMSRKDGDEARRSRCSTWSRSRTPRSGVGDYPHQFSGGMRQRVMIAMSLALDPEVLIADEPTTALDVTVQAQIMDLLAELQRERQMGSILITHDLGVVADVADRIAVMYAGRIVEEANVYDIYAKPAHPYTIGLIDSIPRLDEKGQELRTIKGLPPNLMRIPSGLPLPPALPDARADLRRRSAAAAAAPGGARASACHFAEELVNRG